ncbi:MAG TPA: hypothetical protein VKD23_07905 [Terriglobales bacterium]|nr:hypothetical protein [Terriglobales bacterium]
MSRSMVAKYIFPLVLVLLLAGVALAQDSSGINYSFQGCRNDGSITLPNSNPPYAGQYICPDTAYTGGELGKGWNELDLVPYRLTATATKKAANPETYSVTIAAGYLTNHGDAGYDIISVPVLNPSLSDASCTALSAGAQTIGPSVTNGQGGDQQTIFRNLTITQYASSTCVYDWYQRLAIGSHLNPGASLHSYFFDKSYQNDNYQGHNSDVPIMLGANAGFSVSKTMNAVENTDHDWAVTKTAPSQVMFPNVCSLNQTSNPIQVTVSWQLLPADPYNISVSSTVAVSNNTHRPLDVSVTDNIYSGANQTNQIGTETGSVNNLAPNTQGVNVPLTPSSLTSPVGPTEFNDVASATFTDPVVGDTFPGTAAANTGVSDNGGQVYDLSSIVNETETLTGSLLAFSADSFSPAIGTFDNSYIAGTQTTGPVSWTSNSQSGNGSVTFNKTIYFTGGVGVLTSGDLADTATLTGSDYATTGLQRKFSADVKIVTDARVTLTIQKKIDFAPSGGSQTFNFHVRTSATATNDVTTATLTFNWPTDGTSKTVVVPDLAAGTYFVTEDPATGWTYDAANSTPQTTITLPSCGGNVVIANKHQAQDLTVSKTATATFSRKYDWSITKNVDKTTVDTTAGTSVTFNYTVDVAQTGVEDSNWKVSGVVSVTNPNASQDFTGVNVADVIDNAGNCSVDSFGGTVPAGQTVNLNYVCSYTSAPNALSGTNTASATWSASAMGTPDGVASGTATYAFGAPSTLVNQTVTVQDNFNSNTTTLGTVTATNPPVAPASASFQYSHTVAAPSGTCNTYNNTATIVETAQTAARSVQVCGGADLTLAVSAAPQFTRTFNWNIQKGVNKTLINTSSPVAHVIVGETGFVDSGWHVSGVATVTNPNDWESIPVVLGDSVSGVGTCSFTGSSSLTLGPGQSVPVAYNCTYPAFPSPPSGTDTATATWDKNTYFTPDGSATNSASFSFTGPTNFVNQTVTLTESFNSKPPVALGTVTATQAKPWATKTFLENPTLNFPASGCINEPNLSALPPTTLTSSETITLCTSIKSGAKSAGFWALYQGRGLILHSASTAGVCNAGTWLLNDAPFQDLSPTASCSQVQSYVTGVFSVSSSSVLADLKMQALATALNVYFSDPALGGNTISAPAPLGNVSVDLTHVCVMKDTAGTGVGTCTGTVGSSINAFGGATQLTVSQMLAVSSSLSNAGGTVWYSSSATQALAKDAFDVINNQKAMAP